MSKKMPQKAVNPLIEHVNSMKNASILVVGDIMLDRFVYGDVDRISPESPVPVLSVKRENQMLGGAGNALANLAGLGAKAKILSVIGEDDEGTLIREQAEKLGVDVGGLLVDPSCNSIVKTRFLAGHQQLLRTDVESKTLPSDDMRDQLLDQAKILIKDTQVVILSDYGKGVLQPDVIKGLIDIARKNDVPVIVDPKGQDFSIYAGANVITPNKKELSEATRGMPVSTDEEVVEASHTLMEECDIEAVVATRSSDGMSIIRENSDPVHLRTSDIEVFDVSGAGDTVIATLAAAFATGADLSEAGTLANIAGSIVVTKVGTAPIRSEELTDAIEIDQTQVLTPKTRQAPIMNWPEAEEQIKRWQARGLKTGFTNGCFDILHFGHVSYLNEARGQCDRLIVGLNNDSSVQILKGEDRPVHDEKSRAAVLGALGAVDMVVLFGARKEGEDNTAIELLSALQPEIYFKGGDYTIDQIPEAPTVQSYGGEVLVMPVFEGHSTSESIKKAKNKAA